MKKVERIATSILAVSLFMAVVNSTGYFLGIIKVNIIQWIVFNACAPSSILYLLGLIAYFITKSKKYLIIALVPMMFFGTMGLFVFPWSSRMDLLIQLSHIIMTLNIALGLWITIKDKDYKALGNGLLISILIGIPFIAFTQQYCRMHAEDLIKILGIY